MTLQQILRSHDDEYLLSVRKYIEKNSEKIQADLIKYNQENDENFKLVWGNRDRRPRRLEAIANLDALLKLYPEGPWHKDEGVLLIKANGKESFTDRSLIKRSGKFFQHLGKEFIQPENYLSLLGGTAVLAIAPGNIPLAMSTKKILKQAIETKRYDKEWDEFLRDAPKEVLNTLLLSSGFGAGRFYKILALGSAQGAIQSVVTGQNVATGAGVGAGINLFQYYILPPSIGRPTSKVLKIWREIKDSRS
jgi:hypothetical protein